MAWGGRIANDGLASSRLHVCCRRARSEGAKAQVHPPPASASVAMTRDFQPASRLFLCCFACSGGTGTASPPSPDTKDSFARRSSSRSRSCFVRAAAPALLAATFWGLLAVIVLPGLMCKLLGCPARTPGVRVCSLLCLFSDIVAAVRRALFVYAIDGNRALMFKSAVADCRKRGGERCQEHAIAVVELAGSAAQRVPDKRVAFEVSNKPGLVLDREKHGRHRRVEPKYDSSQRPCHRRLEPSFVAGVQPLDFGIIEGVDLVGCKWFSADYEPVLLGLTSHRQGSESFTVLLLVDCCCATYVCCALCRAGLFLALATLRVCLRNSCSCTVAIRFANGQQRTDHFVIVHFAVALQQFCNEFTCNRYRETARPSNLYCSIGGVPSEEK